MKIIISLFCLLSSTLSIAQVNKPTGAWSFFGGINAVAQSVGPSYTVNANQALDVFVNIRGISLANEDSTRRELALDIDTTRVFTDSNALFRDSQFVTRSLHIDSSFVHPGNHMLHLIVDGTVLYSVHLYVLFPEAVAEVQGQNISAVLYPNPSTGNAHLSIKGVGADELNLGITDMSGRVCYKQTLPITQGNNTAALPTLRPGLYFVALRNKSGSYSEVMKWVEE